MSKDGSNNQTIQELTTLIEQLEINQRQISNDIKEAKKLITDIARNKPDTKWKLTQGTKPTIGDTV
jgi:ABC-type transporter Mla subunit MlaD